MSKLYLLYHAGYETGQTLSEALKDKMGSAFVSLKSLVKVRPQAGDILVRWGSTRREDKDNAFTKVVNSASAILRNTNKLRSLSLFQRAGLNVARFYTNKRDIQKFPVLGRDKNHHGGLDIVMIQGNPILRLNNFSKIPNKDFYVEYIPSKVEYRVHVFDEKIIRVTKKVFRGHDRDGKPITQKGTIKNDTYGWGHQNIEIDEFPREFRKDAIAAVKAIGLDFGAVDMLISAENGKPYILEVNSCPRLNSIGLEIYADTISSLLKGKRSSERRSYIWG